MTRQFRSPTDSTAVARWCASIEQSGPHPEPRGIYQDLGTMRGLGVSGRAQLAQAVERAANGAKDGGGR